MVKGGIIIEKKKKINSNYLPKGLSRRDRIKQKKALEKARKGYKEGNYIPRPHLNSFKSKPSKHIQNAINMYGLKSISSANIKNISKKTGCSIGSLMAILKKGMGAYYSSGSRPNQTSQSWANARLGSSLTGGPASAIDIHELRDGHCSQKIIQMAERALVKKKMKRKMKEKIKYKIIDCCKHTKKNKKCIRMSDKKTFSLPRKFSKAKCKQTKKKGFTMRSSCAPYSQC